MPRGTASSTETIVARIATSRLSGSRIRTSSMTGCPVHSDLPKSSRSTPHIHWANCTGIGSFNPSSWRMAAICFGSIRPVWSPPRIRSVTSPGITRMITNTTAATPNSVGTISKSRFARYVRTLSYAFFSIPALVFREPDVLELLVRVVVGRRHVVLQLGPVHEVARPPETAREVRVVEDELLDLVDEPLALGRVERARLAREEVVDPRIGEA